MLPLRRSRIALWTEQADYEHDQANNENADTDVARKSPELS